jgi:hypothetical protein
MPSPKQRGCACTTDIFVGRARASGARPLLDHPERSIGDVARIAPPALVTKGTNSRLVDRRLVNVLGRAPRRRTARDADALEAGASRRISVQVGVQTAAPRANDPVARPEDGVEPVDHRDVLTDLLFQFDKLRALIPGDEAGQEFSAFDLLEHIGD